MAIGAFLFVFGWFLPSDVGFSLGFGLGFGNGNLFNSYVGLAGVVGITLASIGGAILAYGVGSKEKPSESIT